MIPTPVIASIALTHWYKAVMQNQFENTVNAIELDGVTKRFGAQTAVDSLNLVVPQGSIYGFIGPNGSGKTTTLRMILRIYQPDTGNVSVLGNRHGKVADDRLGYLPEERGLYKRMRVGDLLRYYAKLKGNYDCKAWLDEWLGFLDATTWVNKRIDTLSKGMAQKIQFVAAISGKPQLVILDEPFSGLDPVNMESLRDAVLLLRERGTTVIFSTHDMDMAEQLCDTIFMIFKGRKVLDGTLDAIQEMYPANHVRIRFADPSIAVPRLPEIKSSTAANRSHTLEMRNPQDAPAVLAQLAQYGPLVHFEVIRPTLHEIFVQIARPTAAELGGPVTALGEKP
jgi:ABC-2 type transport system ATP-binding protein